MRNLSFVMRLMLSNLAFALPMGMLMYFMYSAQTVNIEFAEQEKLGDVYQRPLEDILKSVSQHRVYWSKWAANASSSQDAKKAVVAEADAAWEKLKAADAEIGAALQFTPEGLGKRKRAQFNYKDMRAAWDALKSKGLDAKAEDVDKAHADLIAGIRMMITHAGDTSNLILDPDLDSYYLMDVTLGALPQIQDHLQEVMAAIEPVVKKGQPTADEKVKAAVYAFMLKDTDLARVTASAETAYNEDPNFYGVSETLKPKTEGPLADSKRKVETLAQMLSDLAAGKPVAHDAFMKAGDEALLSSFQFWTAAVGEMDVLLEKRLTSLRSERRASMLYAGLAMVLAWAFSIYIGRSLKASMASILGSVERLKQAAETTGLMSASLTTSAGKVTGASTQQAAAVQETVASLTEIDAMVSRSTMHLQESANIAEQSANAANRGKSSLQMMMSSMDEIARGNALIVEEIEKSNGRISELAGVISTISDKTKVINDIVFQTKLLSFNASVEAARAGEHGKGFAVVAEEVGNLARMSGSAAGEINSVLNTSIEKVNEIVDETKQLIAKLSKMSEEKVSAGITVSKDCATVFEDVTTGVTQVSSVMKQVTESQSEQAKGVSQISEAVHDIDSSTQQNALTAEETSHLATRLSQQATLLRELVEGVRAEILGNRAQRTLSAEAAPLHSIHESRESMEENNSKAAA